MKTIFTTETSLASRLDTACQRVQRCSKKQCNRPSSKSSPGPKAKLPSTAQVVPRRPLPSPRPTVPPTQTAGGKTNAPAASWAEVPQSLRATSALRKSQRAFEIQTSSQSSRISDRIPAAVQSATPAAVSRKQPSSIQAFQSSGTCAKGKTAKGGKQ